LDADVLPTLPAKPRLLKIDVEGAELDVLDGGERLFAELSPDYVIAEVGSGRANRALVERIVGFGYERIDGATPFEEELLESHADEWYANVLFRRR
jgi:hypothetical protein